MVRAIEVAAQAADLGEVPVGAVVVRDQEEIAVGRNSKEQGDPTGHAELNAIRAAARSLGDWRLQRCTLITTLEPCLMCAGAIIQSRLERVVFGATDRKFGAVESQLHVFEDARWNHIPKIVGGIEADRCAELMRQFFRKRRAGLDIPGKPA